MTFCFPGAQMWSRFPTPRLNLISVLAPILKVSDHLTNSFLSLGIGWILLQKEDRPGLLSKLCCFSD